MKGSGMIAIYYLRVDRLYEDIQKFIKMKEIHRHFELSKLPLVISRVIALLGPLVRIFVLLLQAPVVLFQLIIIFPPLLCLEFLVCWLLS